MSDTNLLGALRVLDATRLLPGPYASWLLAGMGADVIKVEESERGDYIRYNYPRRSGLSTVFHIYNRGKRSVALNLKHSEGRAAFMDLVETADIIIDGNRPGVMERLRCGWPECHERNPRIVYCSLTGFGLSGPYRNRVGHDINYLSLAGALSGLAAPDGRPVVPRLNIADTAAGMMCVVGALAATLKARETGDGRLVDISMVDTVFSMQGLRLAEELVPGQTGRDEIDDSHGDDWELGVYETADGGFISLDPYEDRFKRLLWSIIEAEGCGHEPDRSMGKESVQSSLALAIGQRSRARWEELLSDADVCFAPVYAIEEISRDPNVAARKLLGDAMDPSNPSPGLRGPIVFNPPASATPLTRAPRLGEHTEEVLGSIGWKRERLVEAARVGAIRL